MPFTPLHRALGLPPSSITAGMILEAIARGVEEDTDLEWKSELPAQDVEEFAKDVASMANSLGGLIVFGVGEAGGGSSAAARVQPISSWGDAEQRRLRSIALSTIQPPIHGLVFTELVDESGARLVALDVPASQDAPHLVTRGRGEAFTAPVRYGAQTTLMGEAQLAAAYRDRRAGLQALNERLNPLGSDAVNLVPGTTPWMTVAAVPHRPRPAHLGRLSKKEFTDIAGGVLAYNPLRVRSPSTWGISAIPGLRRWSAIDQVQGESMGLTQIHDDGSALLAGPLLEVRGEEAADLHPMHPHEVIGDGIWLAQKVAEKLGVSGQFTVRVGIHRAPSPFWIRHWEYREILADRGVPVARFEPIDLTWEPTTEAAAAAAAHELALDVLNQAGLTDVNPLYLVPVDDFDARGDRK